MLIRDYQAWLRAWDQSRGWNHVLLSHTLLHALEELGEVSKLAQMVEGYRALPAEGIEGVRDQLALELSDLQVMLFKIACHCGIDMETAMRRGMEKANTRYPNPADGPAELDASWRRFAAYLDEHELRPLLDAALSDSQLPATPPAPPSAPP